MAHRGRMRETCEASGAACALRPPSEQGAVALTGEKVSIRKAARSGSPGAGLASSPAADSGTSTGREAMEDGQPLLSTLDKGLRVLVLHLGGKARRGAQSDDFNTVAANAAGALVVVKAGDEDQLFSRIAAERKVPIDLVEKISDAGVPISKMLK